MSAGPRITRRVPKRYLVATAVALAALGSTAPAANAGRLMVTGHDADHHCIRDSEVNRPPGCRFLTVGVNYVRAAAPDPTKPVLILDRGPNDLVKSIEKMNAAGTPVPFQAVDPRSPEFAALPLTPAAYSAILIASSKDSPDDPTPQDLNEFGSTPDTDAINARAADIAAFFDGGGGLGVFSGGAAGRANSAAYYRFLNITRGGAAVSFPFTLTPVGRSVGWQDARQFPGESNDINCCETHISFELPAPESPLKVAETDKAGRAVTMVADTPTLATIEEPVVAAAPIFSGVAGSSTAVTQGGSGGGTTRARSVCVPRRPLRISLRRPSGVRFARISVYVNNRLAKRVAGRRLGSGRRTRAFTVRLSQRRTSKVLIVADTASGRKLTYRQTYRPCGRR